jgi:hypothetical protein
MANPVDVSRQVGDGEAIASPTAEANVISTKETAAAASAPAITGPQ